jgi:hypothetical protein
METPRVFPSFHPKASQISAGIVTLIEFPIFTAFILNSISGNFEIAYDPEMYYRVYSKSIRENTGDFQC